SGVSRPCTPEDCSSRRPRPSTRLSPKALPRVAEPDADGIREVPPGTRFVGAAAHPPRPRRPPPDGPSSEAHPPWCEERIWYSIRTSAMGFGTYWWKLMLLRTAL